LAIAFDCREHVRALSFLFSFFVRCQAVKRSSLLLKTSSRSCFFLLSGYEPKQRRNLWGGLSLKIKLRSADQYPLWLARITDLCWAKTKIDVSSVKDSDCGAKAAVASYGRGRKSSIADDSDDEKEGLPPWVQKCWLIITTSLHEVFKSSAY